MSAKEIAEKTKVKLSKVYYVAGVLGRLPTVEELLNWKGQKRGRPPKRWKENEKES